MEPVHDPYQYFEEPEHPPPSITSPGVIATDITEKLRSSVKTALEPGNVIKDGYFSLLDAISALEIMDPKMDSGCPAANTTDDEDYDVEQALSPEQVLGVMDELLCHEMAWHAGHPLSLTVLANVYIDSLSGIKDLSMYLGQQLVRQREKPNVKTTPLVLLGVYCAATLKTCFFVNELVKAGYYYEEEDFVTTTFHNSLLQEVDLGEICSFLIDARQIIDVSPAIWAGGEATALGARLDLRLLMLEAIEESLLERPGIERIINAWQLVGAQTAKVMETHDLGVSVPGCFSNKISRRLASTLPPRPVITVDFGEAVGALGKMCADNAAAARVLDYTDPASAITFILLFQDKHPLVFTRALLQKLIGLSDEIMFSALTSSQFIDEHLMLTVLPNSPLLDPANEAVEAPQDPRFRAAQTMSAFRAQVHGHFMGILIALTSNKCRMRRTLVRSIQTWHILGSEVQEIEANLPREFGSEPGGEERKPLGAWVLSNQLKIAQWAVQMGFEQDIYQPWELVKMYALLSHVAKLRVEVIRSYAVGSNGVSDDDWEDLTDFSGRYPAFEIEETAPIISLAEALTDIFLALKQMRLLLTPKLPYSSDSLRDELRMRPFEGISDHLEGLYSNVSLRQQAPEEELLDAADHNIKRTKEHVDKLLAKSPVYTFVGPDYEAWLDKMRQTKKSAILAGITIATLRKVEQSNDKVKAEMKIPPLSKRYHAWWTVPQVTIIP